MGRVRTDHFCLALPNVLFTLTVALIFMRYINSKIREGVFAAGNWIIDRVKIIDIWPSQDGIARIIEQSLETEVVLIIC